MSFFTTVVRPLLIFLAVSAALFIGNELVWVLADIIRDRFFPKPLPVIRPAPNLDELLPRREVIIRTADGKTHAVHALFRYRANQEYLFFREGPSSPVVYVARLIQRHDGWSLSPANTDEKDLLVEQLREYVMITPTLRIHHDFIGDIVQFYSEDLPIQQATE